MQPFPAIWVSVLGTCQLDCDGSETVKVGRRGFGLAERGWRFLGVGMEGLRGGSGVLLCCVPALCIS
jgi:hypothetical protein